MGAELSLPSATRTIIPTRTDRYCQEKMQGWGNSTNRCAPIDHYHAARDARYSIFTSTDDEDSTLGRTRQPRPILQQWQPEPDYSSPVDFEDQQLRPPVPAFSNNPVRRPSTFTQANPSVQLRKKVYCTHWLSKGKCDCVQTGFRFSHDRPDEQTLADIGVTTYPDWQIEHDRNSRPFTVDRDPGYFSRPEINATSPEPRALQASSIAPNLEASRLCYPDDQERYGGQALATHPSRSSNDQRNTYVHQQQGRTSLQRGYRELNYANTRQGYGGRLLSSDLRRGSQDYSNTHPYQQGHTAAHRGYRGLERADIPEGFGDECPRPYSSRGSEGRFIFISHQQQGYEESPEAYLDLNRANLRDGYESQPVVRYLGQGSQRQERSPTHRRQSHATSPRRPSAAELQRDFSWGTKAAW